MRGFRVFIGFKCETKIVIASNRLFNEIIKKSDINQHYNY